MGVGGQHILACGATGSGKSQALLNYIYASGRPAKPTFQKVYLVYKTYEAMYRYLADELKDRLVLCEGLDALPPVSEFADSSEKNQKQTLVVFDDVVNDKDTKSLKKLQPYYTFGRKKGLTCFFLSQSFFQTDIFIRKQTSWVLLCGIRGDGDLAAILRNYSFGRGVDLPAMIRMYQHAKERTEDEDLSFLKICTYECPLAKKFSRNFLEYLDPKDFGGPEKKERAVPAVAAGLATQSRPEEEEEEKEDDAASDDEQEYFVSLADILGSA